MAVAQNEQIRRDYLRQAIDIARDHEAKTGEKLNYLELASGALNYADQKLMSATDATANKILSFGTIDYEKQKQSIFDDVVKHGGVSTLQQQHTAFTEPMRQAGQMRTNEMLDAVTPYTSKGKQSSNVTPELSRFAQSRGQTMASDPASPWSRMEQELDEVIGRIGGSGGSVQGSKATQEPSPTSEQVAGQSIFSRIDQMLGEVDQVEQSIGRNRNVSISPDTTLNWTQIPEAPVYDPQNFAMQGRTRGMMPQDMEMPQDDLHARQRGMTVSPENAFNFDTEKGLSEGMKWVYGVGLGKAQGVAEAVGGAAIYAPRVALKGYLSLYDMLFGTNQAENNAIMKQIDNAAEFWSQETGKMEVDLDEMGLSKGQQFVSSSFRAAMPSIIFGAMAAGMMGATKAATTPLGQSMAAGPFGKAFPTLSKYLQGSWSRLAKMTPFGVRVLGGTARQAEEEGATVGQQLAVGSTTALAEMLTEIIPFEMVMDTINVLKKTGITELAGQGAWRYISYYGGKVLPNALKSTIFEGLEEVIMEPMGNFIEKSIYKPEMKLGEVVNPAAMKEAFVAGIGMMLVMAALGLPGASASFKQANRIIRADNAEAANKKALAELGESIGRDAAFVDQMLRISESENKSIKLATPSGQIVDGQLVNFNFVTGDMQVQLSNGQAMRFTMEQVGEAQDGIINVNTEIEQIAEPVAPVQSAQILPGIQNFKQAADLMKDLVRTDPAQAWELKQQVVQAQALAQSGNASMIAPDLAQELKKMPTIGVNSWYPSIVDPNVVAETPQMEQVSEVGVAPESGTETAVGALVSPQVDGATEVPNVFYATVGNNSVEVIKNPTDRHYQDLKKEFRKDLPNAPVDEPYVRSTHDAEGNVYIWRADHATHDSIEQYIKNTFGITTNQNVSMLQQPTSAPVESAKEPWEMTREEYEGEFGKPKTNTTVTGGFSPHKNAVSTAINQGKSVPAEVLKDYPDLKPTDTRIAEAVEEAPKVEAPKELPPVQTVSTGNKVTVYSEDNKPVEVQYAVVDAGQLITSHDTSLQANPDYPQELQPRGRGKVASEMQITNIASTLNPERLGANPMISDGAPIIGNDGVVETGNGRTIALKRVYEKNTKKAQEYKTWLANNAEALGLDKAAIEGINNPVLVRIRQTEVDRVAFTQDGNVPTVATMSAGEAATQDSKKLNSKVMSAFVPNEDGRIDTPANRNFVRSFIETVVPKSERGQLIDANGKELTQDGVRRIRNAIFARVYGDANALDKLAEDANVNVKNQITSMVNSAPMLLEMKEGIAKGDLFPLDITKDIAEAMVKLSDLRDTNMSVKEYLQQNQLFGDDLSPIGKDILDVFDRYKRSSTKITGILQEYARMADLAGSPQQDTLFGQNPPTVAEVFRAAVEKVANLDEGQITLFQNQAVGSGRTQAQIGTETTAKAETPAPVKGDSKSQLDAIEAELSKEVDEVIGDVGIPVGQSIQLVGGPGQQAQTGSTHQFADATVGERIKAAHGVTAPNFWQKVKAGFTTLREMSTREFEHLPGGKEYSPLRFALRRLQKQRDVATDRTLRAQQGVLIDLINDKESYSQFELKVLYNDLKASIEQDPNTPLPFGLTPRKLDAEIANLDQAIQGNTAIAGAISKRTKLWEALIKDYTAAMDAVGFDVSERFKRKDYFRHMVLEYANAKGQGMKSAGDKLKVPTNRSFAKERRGSELDINSNYLESEYEVMAQMFYDIEIAKTIQFINENYNIIDQVQEDAKIENMGVAKEDRKKWDEFIPEGYVKYYPREGTIFFFADTIDARMAEQLRDGQVSELSITADQLKTVLAKGGRYRPFVVPNEVALTIDNMLTHNKSNPFAMSIKKGIKAWKVWQLISPKRYIKYNLRNITGDADAAFVGNPTTFAKLPQAAKELYQVFAGDKGMTPNLKDWFERGGMQTLLQVQEMGDINNLRMFMNLMDKKGSVAEIPTKIWQGYWQKARLSTDYREALLRYAAYLDYLDQLEKGNGKPRNFGASVREEIMALKSNKDKAFELANDLLGAYDKVSVTGQFLREYLLPFWSWKEVNFKRYVQFMKNAAHDGETAEVVGRSFMHGLKKSPLIAFRIGVFVLKATALSGMLQAWNHLRFPEEEKELSEDVRNTMHIVLGRDKNGEVLYFTRLGALGDFLEWFGMDGGTKYVKDFLNGRASIGEIASEMAKSPLNVVAQGLGPFKTLAEFATGRNLFPNVFKPTKIHDRWEYLFAGIGLREEYNAVRGRPARPFSNYLRNFVMYSQEEGQGAYYDILDEVYEYKRSKNQDTGGSFERHDSDSTTSLRSTALHYAKLAIRYGDQDAYERYMTEYVLYGGTKENYQESLKGMHPLSRITKEEDKKDFVLNFLDDEGRERLDLAEKFYNETLLKTKWE